MNKPNASNQVIAGYPEFWQRAHDKHPDFFKAACELEPLMNHMFQKSVAEPLHKVIRHLAKILCNSLGALTTLVLNGYGNDAMKVARSMYEGAVTVGYLKKHPEALRDYFDFHWIRQKRLYDYLATSTPEELKKLSDAKVAEMHRRYEDVVENFKDSNGRPRRSWSKVPLRRMAEEMGLGNLYPTFYSFASSMHHMDIGALATQADEDTLDVQVAPSEKWLGEALIMGHNAVLHVLNDYNEVAALGMDKEIGDAMSVFKEAWRGKQGGC